MTISILQATALSAVVFYVYTTITSAFRAPLRRIPAAHWTARFSSAWILWTRYSRKENNAINAAHQRLGPVVRLAPYEISVNDLDGIRTVYTGGWEKHSWYLLFRNFWGVENMFTMLHSHPHSQRKRMLSNIYAKSFLQGSSSLEAITEQLIRRKFVGIMKENAENGDPVSILNLLSRLTMDAMSAYIFGLPNGTAMLDNPNEFDDFERVYTERGRHAFVIQETPALLGIALALRRPPFTKKVSEARDAVDGFCTKLCGRAQESITADQMGANDGVVFRQMTKAMNIDPSEPWDDSQLIRKECASELLDHLLAGFETTAIGLTYALYWLSKRQDTQTELRKELQGLEANGSPSARELEQLPLLQAILMETLRLNPPIPGPQPRLATPGATINGYGPLPPNVRVSAQPYSLHRNPSMFPDPEAWEPSRWIAKNAADETRIKEMSRWFWAFSSGGRMCIGSNFAIQESKAILAATYSQFETEVYNASGIEQEDGYTVGPKGNVTLLFTELKREAE